MTNPGRKKRKKNTVLRTVFRLFFFLLLLSMLAAYISNQVAISSKRAELQTLNEQIEQQQTKNEELQRILSGDADDVTEWVARDSYNYAAPNERQIRIRGDHLRLEPDTEFHPQCIDLFHQRF